MPITYNSDAALIQSTDASGSTEIANSDDYRRHQFGVTISSDATVTAEWSVTGTMWLPAADALTATGTIYLDGIWPHLRISWTGNNGTVTVDHAEADDSPAGW